MFQRIRDLVADVCRYEETAPINSACMRCILLWSAVVLVMLNLSYNSFDRPIVFVSTLFICLTLFGVSLLLSHVRHPKRTVLAGAVLIVLMSLCSFVSNENDGFQTLWLFLLPAILLIQLGLKQAVPICSAYGLCAMVLLWGSPERLEPDCPLAGRCGGCQFRHMTYAEELLEIKADHTPVTQADREIEALFAARFDRPAEALYLIGEETVDVLHSVVLSGGSAYGLAASVGVAEELERHGIGLDVQVGVVPIVSGACLFDLAFANPHLTPTAHDKA